MYIFFRDCLVTSHADAIDFVVFFVLSVCGEVGGSSVGDYYNDDTISGVVGKGDLVVMVVAMFVVIVLKMIMMKMMMMMVLAGLMNLIKLNFMNLRAITNFFSADIESRQLQPTVNTEPLHRRILFS